jgi:xanthine dehydrogenase YagT iron-sulfur-binding subunit
VLAFVEAGSFDELPAATLRAIRAQLRGLGAELVVLSSSGVWRLRPDDPVEQLALPGESLAAEIAVAARHYGVHDGGDAVFVIDGGGVMRFAHRPAQRIQAMFATLETALGIAVETLNARGTLDMVQRVLFTRREWTVTSLVVGCATALFAGCRESRRPPVDNRPVPASERPLEVDITLVINGKRHALSLEPRTSLLDALRERLGLTGTKKGCDAGQCGACTVLVGGKRVVSCLTLAVMAQDKPITTIEGLAKGGELHPMQRAFVEHDGLQCGYCTPGQIMSAVALLDEGRARTDADVREQMSGNICRCGAYPNIVAAIQAARRA